MNDLDEKSILAYPAPERNSYLYQKYSDKVYNLVYRMTGDEELAYDIKQDTFIKVFEHIESFQQRSALYTWIYAIARNLTLQQIKKLPRQQVETLEGLIKSASTAPEPNSFDELESRYYIKQVKEGCLLGVLRCLPFYQRISFILHILLELPVKEVAEVVEKSENSTRILIHRARKSIKDFLCTNCTLYDSTNSCYCENLISFSLEQGWIERYNPQQSPAHIEQEIKGLKDEIALYRSLPSRSDGKPLTTALRELIKVDNKAIFSQKKVK